MPGRYHCQCCLPRLNILEMRNGLNEQEHQSEEVRRFSWQKAGNLLSGLGLRAVKYCEGLGSLDKAFIDNAVYADRITIFFLHQNFNNPVQT